MCSKIVTRGDVLICQLRTTHNVSSHSNDDSSDYIEYFRDLFKVYDHFCSNSLGKLHYGANRKLFNQSVASTLWKQNGIVLSVHPN